VTDEVAVLVMAKAPRPGFAKTRLLAMLGADGCARLQEILIAGAVSVALSAAPEATFVAFDPPDAEDEFAHLVPPGVRLLPQHGGDLGMRLIAAVAAVYTVHPGPLVVVGTDIPLLSGRQLRDAFAVLTSGSDVVLGPACDGGYYLIGMTRPESSLFDIAPELWGGPGVLAATIARAEVQRLRWQLIEELRDLDTPADAVALATEPSLPSSLRPLLVGLSGEKADA
jgi:rSAM/selenodomain-associated transferase 1